MKVTFFSSDTALIVGQNVLKESRYSVSTLCPLDAPHKVSVLSIATSDTAVLQTL